MSDPEFQNDQLNEVAESESSARELALLFGEEIVEQAQLIDIGVLNITDEMTAAIGEGIRQLKKLKNDPEAQRQWIAKQETGLRLLLCLWIMDMGLLEKIRK
jgi:hypothetical protein